MVALSLPGYGFSGKPTQPGYSNRRIAGIIAQLMARLGYTRYGAQGGDWGGFIVRQLGLTDPAASHRTAQQLLSGGSTARRANPNEGVPADEMQTARRQPRAIRERDRLQPDAGHQAADARLLV